MENMKDNPKKDRRRNGQESVSTDVTETKVLEKDKKSGAGSSAKKSAAADTSATGKRSTRHKNNKKHGKHRKLKIVLLSLLIFCLLGACAVAVYAYSVISKAPAIHPENINRLLSERTVIYDDQEKEMDTVFSKANREVVSIDAMPENLKNAFIAIEDKTFYKHQGFNIRRILGAIKESIIDHKEIGGTSTITQQLARNVYLPEQQFDRTISRKLLEAYYAYKLEKALSKDEILAAYLNYIYLGNNAYGVQAAAQSYFSKDVKDLTLAQCAALAALPQAPSDYQLVTYIEGGNAQEYKDVLLKETPDGIYIANDTGKGRRETCLKLMLDQGMISKKDYKEAKNTSLQEMLSPLYDVGTTSSAYFADYVIQEVISDLEKENKMSREDAWNAVYNGGLRIYSTMDAQAQEVITTEFADQNNFPYLLPSYDGSGNILDKNGNVAMYDFEDYFDENGNFICPAEWFSKNDDGSLTIFRGKFLNIYTTELGDGSTDYSLEFPTFYIYADYLYAIPGGFIDVPQAYKKLDENDDLMIDKKLFSDKQYADFFHFNEDGTMTIPSSSYHLQKKAVQPQSAMTIIENSTGHIKAMVGGRNNSGRMSLNRAADSPRQPGSSIKPLGVYAPALQQSAEEAAAGTKHQFRDFGIDQQGADLYGDYLTAASIVVDEKTVIDGNVWPKNFSNMYSGVQTMRDAITQSINTCAVKLWEQVGAEYSADMVKKFGITTLDEEGGTNDINPAALALGGMSQGVTTLEMASAYTTFPNNGVRYDTSSYTKVMDVSGNVILENKSESHRVLDPGVAWIMADMMRDVVTISDPVADISGVFVAGKTGTTNDNFDIWFDGFTPNYSASLWIGNDYPVSLSSTSYLTATLWGTIMRQIDGAYQGKRVAQPDDVIYYAGEYFVNGTQSGLVPRSGLEKKVLICKDSGLLATPWCTNTEEKKFLSWGDKKEEIPKYYCHLHNEDAEKYPITPGMTLPEKPKEDPQNNSDIGTEEKPGTGTQPGTGGTGQNPGSTGIGTGTTPSNP